MRARARRRRWPPPRRTADHRRASWPTSVPTGRPRRADRPTCRSVSRPAGPVRRRWCPCGAGRGRACGPPRHRRRTPRRPRPPRLGALDGAGEAGLADRAGPAQGLGLLDVVGALGEPQVEVLRQAAGRGDRPAGGGQDAPSRLRREVARAAGGHGGRGRCHRPGGRGSLADLVEKGGGTVCSWGRFVRFRWSASRRVRRRPRTLGVRGRCSSARSGPGPRGRRGWYEGARHPRRSRGWARCCTGDPAGRWR